MIHSSKEIQTGKEDRSVKAVLEEGIRFLQSKQIDSAKILAERLLEGILNCKRYELYLHSGRTLTEQQMETFRSFLDLRAEGTPCQYILRKAEFMDFTLEVNPNVLIPRPETEFLIEKVLEFTGSDGSLHRPFGVLDVGTGSGNIAISLATYLSKASIYAVDISEDALHTAKLNSMRNEVSHRIQWLKSDLFEKLPLGLKFDLIVSNPPYLSARDMMEVPAEVAREPQSALYGGERGTETIARLVAGAAEKLRNGGRLFFEIGSAQGREVSEIMNRYGWHFQIFKDYGGLDRVVMAWIN